MTKLAKTRTASESRYKAAISDLQCQLAQREWTTIHSVEFAGVHSVASSMLTLLTKHGIIEKRVQREGKRNICQYKRTARLSNLTASTFRNLNIAYQSQWYPAQLKAKGQLTIETPAPVIPAPSQIEPFNVEPVFGMPAIADEVKPIELPVYKIVIMGSNKFDQRVYRADDCKTVEEAIQFSDSLMEWGDEQALVVEVKAVIDRKTVVTRY